MTKKRISIYVLIFLLILGIFPVEKSYGDSHRLEDLDINVFINKDGSARISERRIANLIEGTENFIVINDLGKSEIKDFLVEEDGREFQYIDNWDIDKSREEKTFKNGIIETSKGYELSWGIGEYGRHEYNLQYTITDFIKELKDSQVIFWRFVNDDLNTPPENVRVTIESEYEFTDVDEKIWAFGYEGNIYFEDGKIVARNNEALNRKNYLTILAQLPEGMFATKDHINKPFEEIKDMAFEGSDYGKEDRGSSWGLGTSIISIIMSIINIGFIVVLVLLIINKNKARPKKFKRKYREEYYRDYPYDGDFIDIYYILYQMGASTLEDLFTGFILKWIHEGKIETVIEEKGVIKKKDVTNIQFLDKDISAEHHEKQLFDMMLQAAGSNRILEEKEFTKWAKKHYKKISRWEENVKEHSQRKLQDLGYVEYIKKRKFLFKSYEFTLTKKGEELEENIYKYINYLYDYSLLNEHEAVNVKIWDNIMIWAAVLGLTEIVRKQFEKLYPNYSRETIYTGNSIYYSHILSRNISAATRSAATVRTSGGGGFSSTGGGGGSFGGGSGGGTR